MKSPRTIRVVAAVLEKDGRYLITQRRAAAVLALMWEFPGGRVEDGETDAQALKREVRHRLERRTKVANSSPFGSHPSGITLSNFSWSDGCLRARTPRPRTVQPSGGVP